tara:strand:- start:1142 stop:1312 length:171 start_codon:yes stop_codon:yes gene_type:complete
LKLDCGSLSGISEGFGFMKGHIMDDNIWEYCNSLRYGFDIEYDEVIFDDDIEEEEE